MAISFPVSLNNFFHKLAVTSASPDLPESMEVEEDGWGSLITTDLGERLWEMDVTLAPGYYRDVEAQKAKLHVLRQAGRPLLVFPLPNYFPANDPDGTILASSTPQLHSVSANMRDIRLSGMPGGFVLKAGDFLSFQYGSNPVRYAFHQIVTDSVSTNGTGTTGLFEVVPNIRNGYATGSEVQLLYPMFKALILPGSTNPGKSSGKFTTGVTFRVRQTLRY